MADSKTSSSPRAGPAAASAAARWGYWPRPGRAPGPGPRPAPVRWIRCPPARQCGLHAAVHGGKPADQRNDLHPRPGIEPGIGQQPQEVVQVAQAVRARWRGPVEQPRQPRVTPRDIAGLPGQFGDRRALVGRRRGGVGVLARELVAHELDQVVLGRYVVVQRHGGDAKRAGDPAHGECVRALRVGDPDGGRGDGGAVVARLRPPGSALGKVPYGHVRPGTLVRSRVPAWPRLTG